MPITVTVLYPNVEDATFNLDYYLSSHMPMVMDRLKSHSMTGWRVVKLTSKADGSPAPYSIQCSLELEDEKELQKGLGTYGSEILGDVPNFSNKEPILMVGDVMGKYGV